MASTCPVCTHSQRHAIDEQLLSDSALSVVGARFGASQAALAAHFAGCLLGVAPETETDKETARRAGVDAQRDAVGAFDAGAVDALLDAILEPQSTASRSQSKGGR